MFLATLSRCFAALMVRRCFVTEDNQAQIKFTLYELSRVEAAGSQCGVDWGPGRPVSLKRRAADAFTVSGRSGLSVGCSSSCPKSGSHAGRTGPMEWGDTGLGQDWTGLGSQYNSKYI